LRSAENDSRRGRNAVLKAEILDLKQGLEAVEDIARSELGLIKKGEIFFLLVED
jgi:cell division protein FtsB